MLYRLLTPPLDLWRRLGVSLEGRVLVYKSGEKDIFCSNLASPNNIKPTGSSKIGSLLFPQNSIPGVESGVHDLISEEPHLKK